MPINLSHRARDTVPEKAVAQPEARRAAYLGGWRLVVAVGVVGGALAAAMSLGGAGRAVGRGVDSGGERTARSTGVEGADHTWRAVAGGFNYLADIHAVSETLAWGVGTGLAKYDGGMWTVADYGVGDAFAAIEMADAQHGWALGARPPAEAGASAVPTIYRIANDRATPELTLEGVRWRDMDLVAHDDVWVLGSIAPSEEAIFHFDGAAWSRVLPELQVDGAFVALDMVSRSDGWLTTARGEIFRWNGATFEPHSDFGWRPTDSQVYDMVANDSGQVWIAGGLPFSFAPSKQLVRYFDSTEWHTIVDGAGDSVTRLTLSSREAGWGVGQNDSLYRFDGDSWRMLGYAASGVPPSTVGIDAIPGLDEAWATMFGGRVYRVTEQGFTLVQPLRAFNVVRQVPPDGLWVFGTTLLHLDRQESRLVDMGEPAGLRGVQDAAVIDADDVWVVGGRRSADAETCELAHFDGTDWERVEAPVPVCHRQVLFTSPSDGWAVGYRAVHDEQTQRFDHYESSVIHFDGREWTDHHRATDVRYFGIAAASADDVWVVGAYSGDRSGGLVRRIDGMSWQDVSVEALQVNAVDLLPTGDGWAAAYGSGGEVLMLRRTGGEWSVRQRHSSIGGYIHRIRLGGTGNGWAVGSDGSVFRLDGDNWIRERPKRQVLGNGAPLTLDDIAQVDLDDGTTEVWAVGDFASILRRCPADGDPPPVAVPTGAAGTMPRDAGRAVLPYAGGGG